MTLSLSRARYRYAGSDNPALDGVDLVVQPGEVVGVVGANDAGKTTLCLVAAGLAPATIGGRLDGLVTIDGLATAGSRPHELAQRCGILFQNPITQLSGTAATVWEEVAFAPRNLGLPLDEIAGVLALRPPYLVLDEPTSQLDPEGTRLVGAALAGLAGGTGAGILVVEHKTDLLAAIAGRIAILAGGQVVGTGPATTVLADERLAEWGITAPSAVSLRRSLRERDLESREVIDALEASS